MSKEYISESIFQHIIDLERKAGALQRESLSNRTSISPDEFYAIVEGKMRLEDADSFDEIENEIWETIDGYDVDEIDEEEDPNLADEPVVDSDTYGKETRRSYARVQFNGTDITEDVSKYLTAITYTDNEEDEADDIQLKFQDRELTWLQQWIPVAVESTVTGSVATPSESTTDPVTAMQNSVSGAAYTVNAKSGLHMRSGAGMQYSVLGTLPFGTQVTVTGAEGNWSIVNHNGKSVYMYTSYLTPLAESVTTVTASSAVSSENTVDVSQYPTLQFGSQGDAVKTMQNLLLSHGQTLPKYGVDGYFGSETQAAVVGFQTSAGIAVSGICDQVTWSALLDTSSSEANANTHLVIRATIVRTGWGDSSGESLDCGQFELDSVEASGPPNVITMKATALPYSSQIRQTKKNRAWESYTLSGIATEMATTNGMTCMYESSYNPTYSHVEQFEESDIAFLSRLAHEAGISLKASNGIIVLFDQSSYEKLGSVMEINKASTKILKYKLGTGECNTKYATCRVSYTNPETGECIEGIAKTDEYIEEEKKEAEKQSKSKSKNTTQSAEQKAKNKQQLEIRAKVGSVGEAQELAKKYLRLRNKFSKTATFSFYGNPSLVAGVCVDLSGFGLWDGKYMVTQAKHTLNTSGYTTSVTLRNVLEGY